MTSKKIQLFDIDDTSLLVPTLGASLLMVAFLNNLSANRMIEGVSSVLGLNKISGIVLFGDIEDSVKVRYESGRHLCEAKNE